MFFACKFFECKCFCHAMWCISAAYAVCGVCVSVCLSICHVVDRVKTNKRIFKIFSPLGCHSATPFQFFHTKRDGNIPMETPPNGGVECRWGRQKSRFWAYIRVHWVLLMLQQARCYQHGRLWIMATVLQVMTLISLVVYCAMRDNQSPSRWFNNTRPTKHALALYTITVDHESCMTARLDVTPKTTEQNRIVRTGKSEAEVTNVPICVETGSFVF